jgi:hypothetical protein
MNIINTYHVPVPVRADAPDAGFLAVLTDGGAGVGDMAVYVGITGHLNPDSAEYDNTRFASACWVAGNGLKLNYRDALKYFPGLQESDYRA